jgi:hypothetical protein
MKVAGMLDLRSWVVFLLNSTPWQQPPHALMDASSMADVF